MTDDTWTTVTRLHDWLTAHQNLPPGQEILLRVLKLSEEVGEAAQAVIGATGQNPRKGCDTKSLSNSCSIRREERLNSS